MFVKYNGILRGMGDVRDATRHPELGWVLKRDLDAQDRAKTKLGAEAAEAEAEGQEESGHGRVSKLETMSYQKIHALEALTCAKHFEAGDRLDFKGALYPTTFHTPSPSPSPSPNPDPNPNPNPNRSKATCTRRPSTPSTACCVSSPR